VTERAKLREALRKQYWPSPLLRPILANSSFFLVSSVALLTQRSAGSLLVACSASLGEVPAMFAALTVIRIVGWLVAVAGVLVLGAALRLGVAGLAPKAGVACLLVCTVALVAWKLVLTAAERDWAAERVRSLIGRRG
jgi:hypothetical protein